MPLYANQNDLKFKRQQYQVLVRIWSNWNILLNYWNVR